MAKVIVKPWVKIFGIAIAVGAIVFGLWTAGQNMEGSNSNPLSGIFGGGDDSDAIRIGTNTYAGFLPFMYLNNGTEPTEDCILY